MVRHAALGSTACSYDRSAPRKPVNLSLNEDLLARTRAVTRNLSATVEDLLAAYIHDDQARRRNEDEKLAEVIAAVNAAHAGHGFLSDEFPGL